MLISIRFGISELEQSTMLTHTTTLFRVSIYTLDPKYSDPYMKPSAKRSRNSNRFIRETWIFRVSTIGIAYIVISSDIMMTELAIWNSRTLGALAAGGPPRMAGMRKAVMAMREPVAKATDTPWTTWMKRRHGLLVVSCRYIVRRANLMNMLTLK